MISGEQFNWKPTAGTIGRQLNEQLQRSQTQLLARSSNQPSSGFKMPQTWSTPAPHAKGTWTSQDRILTARQQGVNPVGAGALSGSFAFKNTAFE